MENKKLLNAQEAREIADTSNCQINRLSKEIELAAKENRTCIEWCVYETSNVVVEKIIDTLKDAGYTVTPRQDEINQEEKTVALFIQW